MKTSAFVIYFIATMSLLDQVTAYSQSVKSPRLRQSFDTGWKFSLSADDRAIQQEFDDSGWRSLNLPHDWSIEGDFSEDAPAGVGGGALPGGVGWYRKKFARMPVNNTRVFIEFDGVYWNSDVWINGHHLGRRPNGYVSFRYELTPYLNGDTDNILVVKVDNSAQPNSRWYSGSGIYRHVWLVTTSNLAVGHWGTYITTPSVSVHSANVNVATTIDNQLGELQADLETSIFDQKGNKVAGPLVTRTKLLKGVTTVSQVLNISTPELWTVENPHLYKAVSVVRTGKKVTDAFVTRFGIRTFNFDAEKGFSLNGKPMKILGVCNHHDLGCLGTAINERALERQLEILRSMGVNAIRTSHNPPAPELLDLCDRMGFLVMDEAFDMWKKKKSPYDYSAYWDDWHERDLRDFILRDRNHPGIIVWSIGNEILEQWDSTGVEITRELASVVRKLDPTRPVTTGNNEVQPHNYLIRSGALDLIGFNYHHEDFAPFIRNYPGQKFIGTETTSALATRGHYDMPSDSVRRWPISWDKLFTEGNKDNTVSAYDHVSAPWGSTHEETWKVVKKYDHLSGMFIWTGFDYIGEPTPYAWPSRSSYFGVIDLAGFPKDSYYMYKSEWTDQPVLHVFPSWNWEPGQTVDMWAYYNNADEVELFINGVSQGVRRKTGEDLHVMWRVKFEPGTVKAVSRKSGAVVLEKQINTAGAPARIVLEADRNTIKGDGRDLSFVTARIVDADGNVVPDASNRIEFITTGPGFVAGTDNGDPVSHESFKSRTRKAFHGLALAVVQSDGNKGVVNLRATSPGLTAAVITIRTR